jgi:hypothetical protein
MRIFTLAITALLYDRIPVLRPFADDGDCRIEVAFASGERDLAMFFLAADIVQ